jgi:hypothetical protein
VLNGPRAVPLTGSSITYPSRSDPRKLRPATASGPCGCPPGRHCAHMPHIARQPGHDVAVPRRGTASTKNLSRRPTEASSRPVTPDRRKEGRPRGFVDRRSDAERWGRSGRMRTVPPLCSRGPWTKMAGDAAPGGLLCALAHRADRRSSLHHHARAPGQVDRWSLAGRGPVY